MTDATTLQAEAESRGTRVVSARTAGLRFATCEPSPGMRLELLPRQAVIGEVTDVRRPGDPLVLDLASGVIVRLALESAALARLVAAAELQVGDVVRVERLDDDPAFVERQRIPQATEAPHYGPDACYSVVKLAGG